MNVRAERARAAGSPGTGRDWLAAAGLAGLAAATRLPLVANAPGEADSARFLIGVQQWRRYGPGGHFIYGAVFSPGYYWLAAHWLAWFGVSARGAAGALAGLSAIAAVLSAPLIYVLGRGCLGRRAAAVAGALFLLTPGYWWLGIEAHPQQVSILLLLAAMALMVWGLQQAGIRAAAACAAAGAAWAGALLIKSDAVLLAPAMIVLAIVWRGPQRGGAARPACALAGLGTPFAPARPAHRRGRAAALAGGGPPCRISGPLAPALPPGQTARPPRMGARGRGEAERRGDGKAAGRAGWGALVVAGGSGLFVLGRQTLLGARLGATQGEAAKTLVQFWSWPGAKAAVRQAAPVVFAAGPIFWLFGVAGMALAWSARRGGRAGSLLRLAGLAAAWVLPIYGFWWVIRGNNARHVALAFLPLLWLGAWGWENWWEGWRARRFDPPAAGRRHYRDGGARAGLLAGLLVLVLATLNAEAVPASSDITLFPSGDVPLSAAMLHAKEAVMRRWALGIERHDGCYFGRYTPPYLIADILAADPAARLARAGGATVVSADAADMAAQPPDSGRSRWSHPMAHRSRPNARCCALGTPVRALGTPGSLRPGFDGVPSMQWRMLGRGGVPSMQWRMLGRDGVPSMQWRMLGRGGVPSRQWRMLGRGGVPSRQRRMLGRGGRQRTAAGAPGVSQLPRPEAARFFTISTAAQIGGVRRACRGAVSLEYDRRGRHLRFLGDEWAGLPLADRFYARP